MTAHPAGDVRMHVQSRDHAPEGPWSTPPGGEIRGPAGPRVRDTRLRVVDQDERADPAEKDRPGLGLAVLDDLLASAAEAAAESDWSAEAMTPVAAIKTVAPRRGEAGNWIIWTAMTLGGLARLILVSLGYLIAKGGETRIRAGVAATVFLLAMALGAVASHQ
jgi:hypothetical protein